MSTACRPPAASALGGSTAAAGTGSGITTRRAAAPAADRSTRHVTAAPRGRHRRKTRSNQETSMETKETGPVGMTAKEQRSRIDRFTRWMVRAEAKQRAKKRRAKYRQARRAHPCGAPACIGGWSDAWAAKRGANSSPDYEWHARLGLTEGQAWTGGKHGEGVFGAHGCNGAKTALQAANYLRNIAKLPRLTRADCQPVATKAKKRVRK